MLYGIYCTGKKPLRDLHMDLELTTSSVLVTAALAMLGIWVVKMQTLVGVRVQLATRLLAWKGWGKSWNGEGFMRQVRGLLQIYDLQGQGVIWSVKLGELPKTCIYAASWGQAQGDWYLEDAFFCHFSRTMKTSLLAHLPYLLATYIVFRYMFLLMVWFFECAFPYHPKERTCLTVAIHSLI